MMKPKLDLENKILEYENKRYDIISDFAGTGGCVIAKRKKGNDKFDHILYWNDTIPGLKDNCLVLEGHRFSYLKDCMYDYTKRTIEDKGKKSNLGISTLILELHKSSEDKIYMLFKDTNKDSFMGIAISNKFRDEVIKELKTHGFQDEIDFIEKSYEEISLEGALGEPLD